MGTRKPPAISVRRRAGSAQDQKLGIWGLEDRRVSTFRPAHTVSIRFSLQLSEQCLRRFQALTALVREPGDSFKNRLLVEVRLRNDVRLEAAGQPEWKSDVIDAPSVIGPTLRSGHMRRVPLLMNIRS